MGWGRDGKIKVAVQFSHRDAVALARILRDIDPEDDREEAFLARMADRLERRADIALAKTREALAKL